MSAGSIPTTTASKVSTATITEAPTVVAVAVGPTEITVATADVDVDAEPRAVTTKATPRETTAAEIGPRMIVDIAAIVRIAPTATTSGSMAGLRGLRAQRHSRQGYRESNGELHTTRAHKNLQSNKKKDCSALTDSHLEPASQQSDHVDPTKR